MEFGSFTDLLVAYAITIFVIGLPLLLPAFQLAFTYPTRQEDFAKQAVGYFYGINVGFFGGFLILSVAQVIFTGKSEWLVDSYIYIIIWLVLIYSCGCCITLFVRGRLDHPVLHVIRAAGTPTLVVTNVLFFLEATVAGINSTSSLSIILSPVFTFLICFALISCLPVIIGYVLTLNYANIHPQFPLLSYLAWAAVGMQIPVGVLSYIAVLFAEGTSSFAKVRESSEYLFILLMLIVIPCAIATMGFYVQRGKFAAKSKNSEPSEENQSKEAAGSGDAVVLEGPVITTSYASLEAQEAGLGSDLSRSQQTGKFIARI